jgi:indole-3-glycerol phosphate synthase
MSVLDEIIAGVKEDLAERKIPRSEIEAAAYGATPVIDCLPIMRAQEMAVIAEVKRSSPSKGALATIADPAALAEQYQEAGASAISVLTERRSS